MRLSSVCNRSDCHGGPCFVVNGMNDEHVDYFFSAEAGPAFGPATGRGRN